MSMPFRFTLLILSLMILPQAGAEQVKGTAVFLQRMALPPSAVFEARVVDVSRADVAAEAIGSVRIENPGDPPIRFVIDVDPKRIDERRRYSVRATITINGKLTLTTDRAHPVLTQGSGRDVELVLRVAQRPAIVVGPRGKPLGALPASFHGDLPCADCEALRYRLNLFADQSYFLGTEYIGRKDGQHFVIGTWSLAAESRTVTLAGGREPPERFQVVDPRTLRKLAPDGSDIDSKLNYTLLRTAAFEPVEPRLTLRGMYRYMADAGLFTDCLTGQRWPVATLDNNASLEHAYLAARREPGQALLVRVDGEVRQMPNMEGKGRQPTLVVRRFIDVKPNESCGSRNGSDGLLDVHWSLTVLNGGSVGAGMSGATRDASLTLHSKDQRVSGSGGCNRLVGSYTHDGGALRFGQMAGTMMACPEGMETEKEFLETLPRVTGWRIADAHLELLDAGGAVLARFEARPAR
jgi:copper homeostasis protein (lipoprotein)